MLASPFTDEDTNALSRVCLPKVVSNRWFQTQWHFKHPTSSVPLQTWLYVLTQHHKAICGVSESVQCIKRRRMTVCSAKANSYIWESWITALRSALLTQQNHAKAFRRIHENSSCIHQPGSKRYRYTCSLKPSIFKEFWRTFLSPLKMTSQIFF